MSILAIPYYYLIISDGFQPVKSQGSYFKAVRESFYVIDGAPVRCIHYFFFFPFFVQI